MGQDCSTAMDEPDIVKTTAHTLTRDDVMDEIQPILHRLKNDEWTTELSAAIAATLTPQKLKVMSPQAKAYFAGWIYEQEDKKYVQWLKEASDDLLSMTWNETQRIPGAKIWSQRHPVASALDKLEKDSDKYSPEQKEFVQARVMEIKECLQGEKERETRQVEKFTAATLKAIEKTEAAIIGRLETRLDEMR